MFEERKLTQRQELFCREYALAPKGGRGNGEAVYMSIYKCSREVARSAASRLLTKVNIRNRIAELEKPGLDKARVTIQRIIEGLADIAFSDPADLYEETGELKSVKDMPKALRMAICSVGMGRDTIKGEGVTSKVKLLNRTTALELLGKVKAFNIFTENLEITETVADSQAIQKAKDDILRDLNHPIPE